MGASAAKQSCACMAATVMALCLAAVTQRAAAMEPAVLVDAELERQRVQFVSLGQGRLSYFDADRRLTRAEAAEHVSLTFDEVAEADESAEPGGRLLLADGHDLPGRLSGVEEGRLLWRHAELGELSIELDDVLVLLLAPAASEDDEPEPEAAEAEAEPADTDADADADAEAEAAEPEERDADAQAETERIEEDVDPLELVIESGDDRVVLRNGDVLSGFVEAVNSGALELAVDGQVLPLAWDRVAAVSLANPRRVEPGDWLELADGSRMRVEDLAMDADEVSGEVLGAHALALPRQRVRSVAFTQQHRLVPLAELSASVESGGVVFGVAMEPRFGREQAQLHAPVTVSFELPGGAKRFAAEASLEPEALRWADLELSVRDEEGESFRAHLNADEPAALINVPVTGRRLTIELEEAANGPVLDRLTLEDAAVLVGE